MATPKLIPLFLLAAGTASGITIVPSASLSINGVNETSLLGLPAVQNGMNSFTLPTALTIPGVAIISAFGYSTFNDPFINYFMGVDNTSNATETYSLLFTTPYIGGPYTVLHDSFTDSLTDGDSNGTVTIGIPAGSTNIAQPIVDGVNQDGQGAGCTATGAPGFSGSCNPGPDLSAFAIPPTGANGTLSVAVNFTVSPGDVYTFNGHADLANTSVPEPATYGMMGLGFGLMLYLGRHRVFRNRLS